MYERIIVPLDGSELAASALVDAKELARLAGAELHLVRVVDYTMLDTAGAFGLAIDYVPTQDLLGIEHGKAEEYLTSVAEALRAEGLSVNTAVHQGRVARVLTQLTKPGDVVVMASHGRGGLSRWFLGSVAEDVVRHSKAPVLLVRARTEEMSDAAEAASTATAGDGNSQ